MTHWGITDGRVVIYDGHAAVAHVSRGEARAVALALLAGQSRFLVGLGDQRIDLSDRAKALRLARDCITVALGEA